MTMHTFLVVGGVIAFLMIFAHIVFKALKFTLSIFFLGIAAITVIYVFQHYFGIDLITAISGRG